MKNIEPEVRAKKQKTIVGKTPRVGAFAARCYEILSKVPAGKVTTYADIARQMNCKAYRAVGVAMKNNPFAPEVPCHRVINSNGSIGGFNGGISSKIRLLEEEGVPVAGNRIPDFRSYLFEFEKD